MEKLVTWAGLGEIKIGYAAAIEQHCHRLIKKTVQHKYAVP